MYANNNQHENVCIQQYTTLNMHNTNANSVLGAYNLHIDMKTLWTFFILYHAEVSNDIYLLHSQKGQTFYLPNLPGGNRYTQTSPYQLLYASSIYPTCFVLFTLQWFCTADFVWWAHPSVLHDSIVRIIKGFRPRSA